MWEEQNDNKAGIFRLKGIFLLPKIKV